MVLVGIAAMVPNLAIGLFMRNESRQADLAVLHRIVSSYSNTEINQELGQPIEEFHLPGEPSNTFVPGSYAVRLKGPKGEGRLEAFARKKHGAWVIDALVFTSSRNGRTITVNQPRVSVPPN